MQRGPPGSPACMHVLKHARQVQALHVIHWFAYTMSESSVRIRRVINFMSPLLIRQPPQAEGAMRPIAAERSAAVAAHAAAAAARDAAVAELAEAAAALAHLLRSAGCADAGGAGSVADACRCVYPAARSERLWGKK
jgi:hypothetical protein